MARNGPSPMKMKMEAARRRPYTPAQEMNYESCECDDRPTPSQRTLDAAADRALSGGYRLGRNRSNVCPDCFTTRTVTGTCNCP